MKTYSKRGRPALAMLLVFCLVLSAFSGVQSAAAATAPRVGGNPFPVETVEELYETVKSLNESGGGTITLKQGVYELPDPLRITSNITLQATGPCLIQCAGLNWTTGTVDLNSPLKNSLIDVDGSLARLTIKGEITVNPGANWKTRGRFFCLVKI